MFRNLRFDTTLLFFIFLLFVSGLFIFGSAALGVLAVNEAKFFSVVESQFIFACVIGSLVFITGALIPYKFYQRYAWQIFGCSLAVTALVFVPGLQVFHGGAHRWIDIGPITIQPSELLKFATVVFIAYWCARFRHHFSDYRLGLLGYLIPIGIVALLVLAQPDFGTFMVIAAASFGTYFIGGAERKHVAIILGIAVIGFAALLVTRPYMMERVKTFFSVSHDPQGASWQVKQSYIALGSGGLFGRGFGQSVQKFNYLPEPIGDSAFAVLGEELGFFGAVLLLLLYGIVGLRGMWVALGIDDMFGKLLASGIVIGIFTQVFLNIGSMIGVLPLTGLPLPLVSHGGTALVITLFQLGVLVGISRFRTSQL